MCNIKLKLLQCDNFEELVAKHKNECLCDGFKMFLENDYILFLYLNLDNIIPEVKASVRVKRDVFGTNVQKSYYQNTACVTFVEWRMYNYSCDTVM